MDSGTLTLLASDDWLEGSEWQPGDGGLQLLNGNDEWVEVQVPPGGFEAATTGGDSLAGAASIKALLC